MPEYGRAPATVLLVLFAMLLGGCATSKPAARDTPVVVAPVSSDAVGEAHQSRQALQEDVMRFADRFAGQLTQVAESVRYDQSSGIDRINGLIFQYASQAAPLDIAMGRNPVTNLFDMMVLATLARHASTEFWADMVADDEKRQIMIDTVARLEKDIWRVSAKVLTEAQQADMMALIDQWRAENPGVRNIWRMRFSAFSGQRAAALQEVQRSGGLMGDLGRSLDAVEEMQETVERLLYYSQRAPELMRLQSEWGVYEVLGQPEIQTLVNDSDRLTLVAEQFLTLAQTLPGQQLAAIDQVMAGIAAERKQLFQDMVGEEPRVRELLGDLRELMTLVSTISLNVRDATGSLERTALAVNLDLTPPENPETVDIADYTELVRESAGAVVRARELVDAVDGEQVDNQVEQLITRAFLYLVALIIVFFASLLLYGFLKRRYL